MLFDFDNKKFVLVHNSDQGTADEQTILSFHQIDDMITGSYRGGSILTGHLLAIQTQDKLSLVYHCVTIKRELKTGRAEAIISLNNKNKIKLDMEWKWLDVENKSGKSSYVEL